MRCPKCLFPNTKVYDSRLTQSGRAIRRRRECQKCGYRYTTIEEVRVLDIKVEKRNGQLVDFDQEKLEKGVRKAFNKRMVDKHKFSFLIQKIIEDILQTKRNPIKSTRIGKIVLRNLIKHDEAAYISFAAMFLNFSSLEDFNQCLKEFQD